MLNIYATRYAVVTGANKGIGFGTAKELAARGITVILTARDERKGLEAVRQLKESGFSDNVAFHQLDVADPASIATLSDFIKTKFGKLDILVCQINKNFYLFIFCCFFFSLNIYLLFVSMFTDPFIKSETCVTVLRKIESVQFV